MRDQQNFKALSRLFRKFLSIETVAGSIHFESTWAACAGARRRGGGDSETGFCLLAHICYSASYIMQARCRCQLGMAYIQYKYLLNTESEIGMRDDMEVVSKWVDDISFKKSVSPSVCLYIQCLRYVFLSDKKSWNQKILDKVFTFFY